MPQTNEFGDEAVESPTVNEFGDEPIEAARLTPTQALQIGPRAAALATSILTNPAAVGASEMGQEQGRAIRKSAADRLREIAMRMGGGATGLTAPVSPEAAGEIFKVPGRIIQPVMEKAHEALAPFASEVLTRTGIDPSSTPEHVINLPHFTRESFPTLPGIPPPAVSAGLANLTATTAESLAQPEQAALIFATGGGSAVGKAAAVLFASDQFAALPDQIKEAIQTINDPKSTTEQKIEAVGKPGVSALLATTMVRAGFRPAPIEKGATDATTRRIEPRSDQPEHIGTAPGTVVSPEPAQVRQGESRPDSGRGGAEQIARGKEAQVQTQVAKPVKPEVARIGTSEMPNQFGDPGNTVYHATPEDWAEWQRINAQRSDLLKQKKLTDIFSVQGQIEAMKNKYGGMPPEAPKAGAEPMVTLYHGEGAIDGGGADTRFFTTDPTRAASYGPNVSTVQVPKSVADAAAGAARKSGSGTSGDHLLPDEWVKKATPMAQPPTQTVHEIPSPEPVTIAASEARPAQPEAPVKPTATPAAAPAPPSLVHANSAEAEIGIGGETGAEMARHGITSGLPPSVPDRGPSFASELMEASRQLGTVVRSRVTLPQGVLGMYSRARAAIGQTDKIEVGDISNQLTVAHEMGHDLDGLLWPVVNLARSQRSLEQRVPGTTGKQLQAELIPVSELMRGPIAGTKGHQAYRRSASELIADFFALYAHDPERARTMAPKFSRGFEDALASKPDAAGVIHQLVEGDVAPVPGESATPGPAAQPGSTPGVVPARVLADPIKRDLPAAQAGENLVKGLVREFAARVEQARIIADRWREDVTGRDDRRDVGAFVEGIGNVEHAGDTIENVKSRMTPEMQRLAKDYRFTIEKQRQEINQYLKGSEEGEYLAFLQDYLPHFYANTGTPAGRSALSRFMKDSPNAKARKLPTVKEAVDLGLIPITQDPAVLFEHHANVNWRTATNRKLMQSLKDMTLSDGSPAVVPAKDAPPGWVITQNPLVQKVYAHQTPNGLMIWKGGAAVHPDVWRAARQMLEAPVSSDFGKGFDAVNAVTRANAFAFSLFHDLTLRSASVGEQMQWYNPVRGLFRLFERNPKTGELEIFRGTRGLGKELMKDEESVTDAARHGLKFSWSDSESYQHNARGFLENAAARWRDVPVLGKSTALVRDLQHMRQEGLWKNTHDAFKLIAYHDAVAKALENAPAGIDPKLIKKTIASRLNDAFGGQEWQTKFWMSPQLRHAMSRFFLAPDWTLSTIRSVPGVSDIATAMRSQAGRLTGRGVGPASFEGTTGNLGRARFWGGEIAALAAATLAAQYAVYHAFGDPNKGDKEWVWENEQGQGRRIDITPLLRRLPWHNQKDPTRYYVNLGKRPEEILAWVTHPEMNIESKMSRPVAEIFKQVSGYEGDFKAPWKQEHDTFIESLPERSKSAGKELVPFVFAGNQFALSVPYRKGMSKSKAQNAYESVYEIAAAPGQFPSVKAFLRGVPSPDGTLQSMVSQITDAAKRNGVPAEEVRRRALSAVRGHHYDLFFKAMQKQDRSAMEAEAEALQRLGATPEQRMKSVERRQALQPK